MRLHDALGEIAGSDILQHVLQCWPADIRQPCCGQKCTAQLDFERLNAHAASLHAILISIKSILSGDTFRLSKVIADIRLMTTSAYRLVHPPRRKQWETQMTKTSFRGFECAISLLTTLSQAMDVRSRLVRSEILSTDQSSLLRLGPVRLRPVLLPIRSSRRRR